MVYNRNMSRRPKKRTKKYSGEDAKRLQASSPEPVVHRYEAVERSKFGQWWHERKKLIRTVAIVVGVVILVIWMVVEIVNLIF